MIELITFAYISVQLLSLVMSWPQVHKLLIMKDADELSLSTWSVWLTAQTVTTLYAATTGQAFWFVASVVWMIFDISMVALIIKYRPRSANKVATELAEITSDPVSQ